MNEKTFSIPNISCGHCVAAIKNELSEMAGVAGVEGDSDSKTVKVKWDESMTEEKILETLREINYPAST